MSKSMSREKREERLFEELRGDLDNRDAETYARLARRLGYEPGQEDTVHQELMERAAADEICRRKSLERLERAADEIEQTKAANETEIELPRTQKRTRERGARSTFNRDIFEEEVRAYRARNGYVELSPFEHIDTKRRILRASGLNYLLVARGYSVPIEEAKSERIGRVFLRAYNALQRRNRQKIGSGE